MGSGGAGDLAVWASAAWSLCEGRLGENKSLYWQVTQQLGLYWKT
jgi:hypothetical protein